jgi:hypothetical protein
MNNIKDIKNVLTTICAWITLTGGSVLTALLAGTITLPKYAVILLIVSMLVSLAITQIFTGRNPNGSVKTDKQVSALNKQSELSK